MTLVMTYLLEVDVDVELLVVGPSTSMAVAPATVLARACRIWTAYILSAVDLNLEGFVHRWRRWRGGWRRRGRSARPDDTCNTVSTKHPSIALVR